MKYNFDEIIDRKNNHSTKYNELIKKFGVDDVIPLWIADMDFKTAEPVINAVKKKAEHGIFAEKKIWLGTKKRTSKLQYWYCSRFRCFSETIF